MRKYPLRILFRQGKASMEIHPFGLPYPLLAPTQKPTFAKWMSSVPNW